MCGMKRNKQFIDLLGRKTTSLKDVIQWQIELREAVDNRVIERIASPFNQEFSRREQSCNSIEEKRDVCGWANSVLRSAQLCVSSPRGDVPSLFVAKQSRPSDKGRFYLRSIGGDGQIVGAVQEVERLKFCSFPQKKVDPTLEKFGTVRRR